MKKRVLAVLMTVAMTIFTCIPVMADSQAITVTAELASDYVVALPANFSLYDDGTHGDAAANDGEFTCEYTVGLDLSNAAVSDPKTNLAGSKKVSIVPDTSFDMNGKTISGNKVTANVAQPNTVWTRNGDAANDILAQNQACTGKVTANISIADSYEGQLTFTYSMDNV